MPLDSGVNGEPPFESKAWQAKVTVGAKLLLLLYHTWKAFVAMQHEIGDHCRSTQLNVTWWAVEGLWNALHCGDPPNFSQIIIDGNEPWGNATILIVNARYNRAKFGLIDPQ